MNPDRLAQVELKLRSKALNERKEALDELAKVPSEIAVPALQRLAAESDFLFRRFAVMGLGNHTTPESLATLKHLLDNEKDSNVLAEIANSLFEFGDEALPLLPELFSRSDNWLVRQSILGILAEANRPDRLFEVIQVGLDDENITTREAAILALGQLLSSQHRETVIVKLLALAQSTIWRNRWRSATVLCLVKDDRARAALAQLRSDENHYVVAAALESGLG